jgi:hypothetical protein
MLNTTLYASTKPDRYPLNTNTARHPRPSPLFVGLNFHGNHSIHPDPTIALSSQWMRETDTNGVVANRATEASRGVEASRWPVEAIRVYTDL